MNWLNKLPGYRRTPYGFELRLLRMMPNVLLAGTLLPVLAAWAARSWFSGSSLAELERSIQTFDFVMIGVVVLVWTAVLTIAIACVIVWLMKGPAYVADAYEVSHSEHPKP
ncbi:MAG: hypothetical protein KAX57_12200 [Rhodoferax sp.]|jgi:hypothetical protein|uniref:hypothetical protein n=1 Tax=Rhodoferax sp. TaxID=50421 RepID=UPI001B706C5F|nr:hypothetical protein [Rhodoferax sp.]MBP8287584.1 hypothetical protein [Rhodoferax sp.]MBP9148990.1 hypothetical protein [Rhodoferax sp.]MBP9735165.1 hypothetical protein [Rhodoferax sp.]